MVESLTNVQRALGSIPSASKLGLPTRDVFSFLGARLHPGPTYTKQAVCHEAIPTLSFLLFADFQDPLG